MKNEFNEAETRERKFIEWYLQTEDILKLETISPIGSFERNDFTFYSGRTFCMGEVKIRTFEVDKYPTAIIESDKVNGLAQIFSDYFINHSGKLLYYAVYPKSRCILIFDILNTPSTITYEYAPKTTMDPSQGHIWKPMVNYKINDAIKRINY